MIAAVLTFTLGAGVPKVNADGSRACCADMTSSDLRGIQEVAETTLNAGRSVRAGNAYSCLLHVLLGVGLALCLWLVSSPEALAHDLSEHQIGHATPIAEAVSGKSTDEDHCHETSGCSVVKAVTDETCPLLRMPEGSDRVSCAAPMFATRSLADEPPPPRILV
ncbi:hypothetical protein ILP92_01905 [Maribius pontilimi]|uniref:Uncharacterized protein n=1 Tax=Palleronia pontilimi TaxID=1964209 RepID=A0A934IEP8_9RHOB|nr:hypothetical protein [Palleronia pontilimi]MBJ3761503.1 hypothetical protein [Palleronia pontilimi]